MDLNAYGENPEGQNLGGKPHSMAETTPVLPPYYRHGGFRARFGLAVRTMTLCVKRPLRCLFSQRPFQHNVWHIMRTKSLEGAFRGSA